MEESDLNALCDLYRKMEAKREADNFGPMHWFSGFIADLEEIVHPHVGHNLYKMEDS